jgi:RimJ/RimL family protein N-acetyltransferase
MMPQSDTPRVSVRIEPWGANDLPLLTRLMGDPVMTEHLGGPEGAEQLAERQGRYERQADSGTGRMFKIVHVETGKPVGSVGYWERDWRGGQVYETGWSVLPEFQGQGIASAGTALAIAQARADGKHQYLHAFPKIENPPSNAVCRKLGFTLLGECDFEYPPGNPIRCNDWRLDLFASDQGAK